MNDPTFSTLMEPWASGDQRTMFERASRLTPEQVADALRAGRCLSDRAFDRFLPDDFQTISPRYWTPLSVAEKAARWLSDLEVRTVIDIGSGVGKFCVAAALAGRCRFVGLEQRHRLVETARALSELFEVEDRVQFVEGRLGEVELPLADAYYLFNPFGENLYTVEEALDAGVELSETRYQSDVAIVEDLLENAPVGTFLITYNGFGGRVSVHYRQVRIDRELPSVLRMWEKITSPSLR